MGWIEGHQAGAREGSLHWGSRSWLRCPLSAVGRASPIPSLGLSFPLCQLSVTSPVCSLGWWENHLEQWAGGGVGPA